MALPAPVAAHSAAHAPSRDATAGRGARAAPPARSLCGARILVLQLLSYRGCFAIASGGSAHPRLCLVPAPLLGPRALRGTLRARAVSARGEWGGRIPLAAPRRRRHSRHNNIATTLLRPSPTPRVPGSAPGRAREPSTWAGPRAWPGPGPRASGLGRAGPKAPPRADGVRTARSPRRPGPGPADARPDSPPTRAFGRRAGGGQREGAGAGPPRRRQRGGAAGPALA